MIYSQKIWSHLFFIYVVRKSYKGKKYMKAKRLWLTTRACTLALVLLVGVVHDYSIAISYMWTLPDLQGRSLKWALKFLLKYTTFCQNFKISLIWIKNFPIYSIHFWKIFLMPFWNLSHVCNIPDQFCPIRCTHQHFATIWSGSEFAWFCTLVYWPLMFLHLFRSVPSPRGPVA